MDTDHKVTSSRLPSGAVVYQHRLANNFGELRAEDTVEDVVSVPGYWRRSSFCFASNSSVQSPASL